MPRSEAGRRPVAWREPVENGLLMSPYTSSDSPLTFLLSPEMLLVLVLPTSGQKMSVCVELLCLRLRLFREWISDR